jgi:hypothetical protein
MYALMCYQSALMPECFITYCTAIRVNTTMYMFMYYQIALLTDALLHTAQI